jgi:hypothetical protein
MINQEALLQSAPSENDSLLRMLISGSLAC